MKNMILIALLWAQAYVSYAGELVSRRFEGTIRSNGIGDFSLMRRSTGDKLITAAELEAFRKDNNGNLVFAVDVNESAKGSENRDSQGIAVLAAWIDVRIDNVLYQFGSFKTQTRSSLAPAGSANRQMYYTLLGEAGSSRITGNSKSDIDGSSFDGTLTIPVNRDISKATTAWIHFRLLQTNSKLGDPERFYDFSGGFEDVAILTKSDAAYLDILQAGRERAPLVVTSDTQTPVSSYVFYPSSSEYYLAAYEDQYPKTGDYDFNDLLVAYRIYFGLDANAKVKTLDGEGYVLARGGSHELDWYLHIPLPASATGIGELKVYNADSALPKAGYPQVIGLADGLNLKVLSNIKNMFFDPNYVQTNTIWNAGFVPGQRFKFNLSLDHSVDLADIGSAPFDPYVYIQTTGFEIHLPGKSVMLAQSVNKARKKTSFKDSNNFPFAMILPNNWVWPNEYVHIAKAYPKFTDYINSGSQSSQDWYLYGVASGLSKHGNKWRW